MGSRISIMIFNITQIKNKSQYSTKGLAILTFAFLLLPSTSHAIVDPLDSPNNKFGIHLISPTHGESSPAAKLVNSSGGDWGYVTIIIESKDRDQNKWQNFFNDLRTKHLIPIIRLATQPDGGNWKLPYEGEEQAWADFLDNLNWPTKNRYIVIYNEPNHGQEWGGRVNARSYAQVLNKTIDALKSKSPDFFVLNAGFDASTPQQPPSYQDQLNFMQEMEMEIPGIFNKLDGWVSHSYPNPGFVGSPNATGRGTVRTWIWELQIIRTFGVTKTLPIFITETGWQHAEGITYQKWLPSSETVGSYFLEAFQNTWNNHQIAAITPFLLNYQEDPFDHFSFKKLKSPDFYPQYQVVFDLPKKPGRPIQENKAEPIKGTIYPSVVSGESYNIPLVFKNTGQSIWNEYEGVELRILEGQEELGVLPIKTSSKIEPGQDAVFNLKLKAPKSGSFKVTLQLFNGNKAFDQKPYEYQVEVKSPVLLKINANLLWKENYSGSYLLSILSDVMTTTASVVLDNYGQSQLFEARYLLPDYTFSFTLQKPFYKPKTIAYKVTSGINQLNFDRLEPDFLSVLLKPKEFWKLLPFSK